MDGEFDDWKYFLFFLFCVVSFSDFLSFFVIIFYCMGSLKAYTTRKFQHKISSRKYEEYNNLLGKSSELEKKNHESKISTI